MFLQIINYIHIAILIRVIIMSKRHVRRQLIQENMSVNVTYYIYINYMVEKIKRLTLHLHISILRTNVTYIQSSDHERKFDQFSFNLELQ